MLNQIRSATDTVREVVAYYFALVLISALVFMLSEGQPWWKSLYWAVMTSTTVGYGDVSPATVIGQADACFTSILSIFVISPLVIVRLIEMVSVNRDAWTHDEQEMIKNQLVELNATLKRMVS